MSPASDTPRSDTPPPDTLPSDAMSPARTLRIGQWRAYPQDRVIHGRPAAEAVREEMRRQGVSRAFILTTRSLAGDPAAGRPEAAPLTRLRQGLGEACVGLFPRIGAHSPQGDVVAAANAARAAGADVLVALGGGSVIDAAKAAQLCLWEGVEDVAGLRALAPRHGRGAASAHPSSHPPSHPGGEMRVIAVSTTLSAAEFTPMAGIFDPEGGVKDGYSNPWCVPRAAILDPAATEATPIPLLVSTGMRAMDHAAEAFCSPRCGPVAEVLALEAARLLAEALPAIRRHPDDLGARQRAQFGMWQAIAALSGGSASGASHAIGYALGAGFGVPHGETSCISLPAVLRWNAEAGGAVAARQARLAAALGEEDRPAWVQMDDLVADLGVPRRLRDKDLDEADLDRLAELAFAYAPMRDNPRPVGSPADVREILEHAF